MLVKYVQAASPGAHGVAIRTLLLCHDQSIVLSPCKVDQIIVRARVSPINHLPDILSAHGSGELHIMQTILLF